MWSGVRYRNLYPGVDLVIGDGADGVVPWRVEVRHQGSPQAISLLVEGADGITAEAGRMRLEMKGRAVDVALPAWVLPGGASAVGSVVTSQEGSGAVALAPGSEPEAEAGSGVRSAVVGASAGIIYSFPFGGTAWDKGYGVARDHLGNAYIAGETESDDFPSAPGPITPSTNAFVAKINAAGSGLLYATYLGGTGLDLGSAIAVDGVLAYVAGKTNSADFPRAAAAAQGNDVFVAALNADGTDLRYATLVGGAGSDAGFGIAVDGPGAYVVGESSSSIGNAGVTHCVGASGLDLLVAKLGRDRGAGVHHLPRRRRRGHRFGRCCGKRHCSCDGPDVVV